ncbi:MAG: alpha/beta fold hydrolase [Pseudomonadota bacterium]
MPMPNRRARAGTLHVRDDAGAGQPVVFLHGLGGTSRYWACRLACAPLEARLVLVDLLGFGDSPRPWCRYTIDRHIQAIHETIKDLDAALLVGHSMGAALALIYAARYPDKVKGLVLISLPYFHDEASAYRWFRRTPSGWLMTNMVAAALACVMTRRVAGLFLPWLLRRYPREVAQDLVKHNFLSSTTSLWEVLYRHDLRQEALRLSPDLPVTCVHAVDDDTAPFAMVEALAAEFPNWQLCALARSGHHPWLWMTETCAGQIQAALARAVTPAADGPSPPALAARLKG